MLLNNTSPFRTIYSHFGHVFRHASYLTSYLLHSRKRKKPVSTKKYELLGFPNINRGEKTAGTSALTFGSELAKITLLSENEGVFSYLVGLFGVLDFDWSDLLWTGVNWFFG